MSIQLQPRSVPSRPAPMAHRHRPRNAVVAGLVVVLAAGTYVTTQTMVTTTAPVPAPVSRAEAIAQYRQNIEALYGPRPAIATDPRAIEQHRQTTEALYGRQPAIGTALPRARAIEQHRQTTEALYGPQAER